MLESVSEVIDELGGNAKAAALVGLGASAVSNWRSRGRIPAEFFLVFSEALKAKGREANPALFGMTRAAGVEA